MKIFEKNNIKTYSWFKIFGLFIVLCLIYPFLKLFQLLLKLFAKNEYEEAQFEIEDSEKKKRKVVYNETLEDREN